jgi:hypothetical protein
MGKHLLRKIDRFIDLSGLRAHLGPYYSDVGRPSIDPELMVRMLIVGYFRSHWNGSFGGDSGPSRGEPSRAGFRPSETSTGAVSNGR